MYKLSVFFGLITVFSFYFYAPVASFAQDYYFDEEFNQELPYNTLDSTKWLVYPNTVTDFPTIRETGGNLITKQQDNTYQYPFIISKDPVLPTGNFSTEIKFQYTAISFWGTGITLSDQQRQNGNSTGPGLIDITLWQDQTTPANMRILFAGQIVETFPINTDPHILKVERTNLKYLLYLDNNLVYTSPDTLTQAKYIWLGNPTVQTQIPSWTKFNVDYIRVSDLGPPQITKTPVLFIPGIGGSELKTNSAVNWSADNGHGGNYSHNYPKNETVWVNEPEARALGNDDYFDILRMKPDGVTSEADITLTGNLFNGAYKPTIDFFTANGYTLNQDLFIFPYDWRKDISTTKDLLNEKITEIKQQTGSQKVDIVAHSMGGLVARNYISDPQKAANIRKLIELGTPHLGSVKPLKQILYGECFTILDFLKQPLCVGLSPSEVKDVVQNMISTYELSPSKKYYDFYSGIDKDHPVPFIDQRDIDNNHITGPLSYYQSKDLLNNLGHNGNLFISAESFHNLDNSFDNTNAVETTIISGSGISTLGQIIERNSVNFLGINIPVKDEIVINGDDTVPLLSASLDDPSQNITLKGSANIYFAKEHHSLLPTSNTVLNLAKNILDGNSTLPSGIQTTPYALNGSLLSVHSPVNIHVYDQQGNHTGPLPNGDFEANIPGSSYDTLDDAKFIFLPNDGIYLTKFEATDQGKFDFKIRDYKNNINDKTAIYKDIPLTSTTQAQTILYTTEPNPPVLNIDKENDGNFESFVFPSSTLSENQTNDQTPPITNIVLSGIQGNNNWYKSNVFVTLTSQDETNGSGINKTEYSLDNGQTIKQYTQPFNISSDGTTKLRVKSTDNAGNEEALQEIEIKVDKSAPEAKIQFNLQTQNFDVLGTDNSNSVTVTEAQIGTIILTDLAGNTTTLSVDPKEKKRKDKLSINSIKYNQDPIINQSKNSIEASFVIDKKTSQLTDVDQKVTIKGEEKLTSKYNPKKNITTITNKLPKEKKEIIDKNGIVLINLITFQGNLDASY